MAVVNHRYKWIYLMEPHTASRATEEYLLKEMGGTKLGHHHIGIPALTRRDREMINPQRLAEYKIISTVRNPFDTLITRWLYNKSAGDLGEWVNRLLELDSLPCADGLYKQATHFVYYEHLEEDLSILFGKAVRLPRHEKHSTIKKEPWQSYYEYDGLYPNPPPDMGETVAKMLEYWAPYLSQFGYMVKYKYGNDGIHRLSCEIDQSKREKLVKFL